MGRAPLSLTMTVAAVSPDRLRLMPEVTGGLEGKKKFCISVVIWKKFLLEAMFFQGAVKFQIVC